MKFINRKAELNDLKRVYEKPGSSLVIIYGRRRTGKTTLINEFIKRKPAIYFLADLQSDILQLDRIKNITSEIFNDKLLNTIKLETWDTFFDYITTKIQFDEKLVVVIDEFQYLSKVNKAIPTIFQRIWDEKLKNKNIMLILCGSIISMMYDSTLSYSSPLYGRRDLQIKLNPLTFRDFKEFFNSKNIEEMINIYSVTGGIPRYIEQFSQKLDLFDNISEYILNKNSPLYSEPKFLLREEIVDSTTYFSILRVISEGSHKLSDISSRLMITSKNITSFLDKLRELEILERIVPVTEENPAKSKKGLYIIKDNFFRFWFRYVFPYQSYLEIGNINYVLEKIRADFNLFVSFIFENICIEHIQNQKLPFEKRKVGKWWDNKDEIDIVVTGKDGVLFGECKWIERKLDLTDLNNLINKSKVANTGLTTNKAYYALYSKRGFTDRLHKESMMKNNILLFDLNSF